MDNTKTVVIYSNENISKYFLSPYVNFSINENCLILSQWLFKTNLVIECNIKKMCRLLEKLSKGLTEQELIESMQEIFAEKSNAVIRKFVKNGIIE